MSIEDQIDAICRSFPDTDRQESTTDVSECGRKLAREERSDSFGGWGGFADLRVLIEITAGKRFNRCLEDRVGLVEVERVAFVVQRVYANRNRNLPSMRVGRFRFTPINCQRVACIKRGFRVDDPATHETAACSVVESAPPDSPRDSSTRACRMTGARAIR